MIFEPYFYSRCNEVIRELNRKATREKHLCEADFTTTQHSARKKYHSLAAEVVLISRVSNILLKCAYSDLVAMESGILSRGNRTTLVPLYRYDIKKVKREK